MTTTNVDTEAVISDEIWEAFVAEHEARLNALDMLMGDKQAQAALIAPTEGDMGPVGAAAPHEDMQWLLKKLETHEPLTPAQAQIVVTEGKQVHAAVGKVDTELHGMVADLKGRSQAPGDAEWDRLCDEKCAATIKRVTDPIKAGFAKIKAAGHKHPGERGMLTSLMNAFSDFAATLMGFLNKVLDWAKKALDTIWSAIKHAAEWVWDKITRAGNAVVHFFAHLF